MADFPVEQALYRRHGAAAPALLARSAGFRDAWQHEAEWLVTAFGDRPAGVACPAAVYAQPFGKEHVAVVQVADQEADGPGGPPALGFRLLVFPREAYTRYLGDPFVIDERLPPSWLARDDLPILGWPAEPLPRRTVPEVQAVLKRLKRHALREDQEVAEDDDDVERTADNSEGPALLGGVQVLVDGGRLVFQRPAPDTGLLRALWTLLPTSTRSHLWPASFVFANGLPLDVVVVPPVRAAAFATYTTEDQAADYPEGRYELRLQTAAEAGDQADLDAVLGRRSWAETWRLGLTLLVAFTLLVLAARLLESPPQPRKERPTVVEARQTQAAIVAGLAGTADPWQALGTYLAARDTLNELADQARR
jgi:hypothetical protein